MPIHTKEICQTIKGIASKKMRGEPDCGFPQTVDKVNYLEQY